MDRRSFLGLAASVTAALAARKAGAQTGDPSGDASNEASGAGGADQTGRQRGPVVVASANGIEAVRIAREAMLAGARPVDAAVDGVRQVELDPSDYTVGYGGLPNFDGVVQLDAAVMDGPSGQGGAVAALEGVKTPAAVAKLVMERTDHVLLVGEGARRFATMHGFPHEELLTDLSRKIWLYWRETLSTQDDWVDPPVDQLDPELRAFVEGNRGMFRPTGTIHLSARAANGDLGCCTTTSGLFFKVPGRVGDSPLIGAGLYCDNDVGSAGGTGRGEAAILSNASHTAVERMRAGRAPEQALLETLERVAHLTRDPRLRRDDGRPNFNLRLYAVDKAGRYASAAIWGGGKFAVADAQGARLEDQAHLYPAES
jgi:N4-(beta-N-acetylglucosaminyl)-L-asparaginase